MADRVGVMRAGQIEQIGTPAELYSHPQTPFISSFVGIINRIPGIVNGGRIRVLGAELDIVNRDLGVADNEAATALIRPEDIELVHDDSARFKVMDKQLRGIFTAVMVQDEVLEQPLRIDLPTRAADRFQVGMGVQMAVQRRDTVIDHPTEREAAEAQALSQVETYR